MATTDLNNASSEEVSRRRNILPRWIFSNTAAATGLIAAGAFAFITTWVLLSPAVESINRDILLTMIIANVVIAVCFMALIGARLWHVWSDRRNQLAGSQTHMQLVGFFSIVAAIPALIAFIFSFTVMRTSWDDLFSSRIDSYVDTSRELANSYFDLEANSSWVHAQQIELDLNLDAAYVGLNPATAPIPFRQRQVQQAAQRDLAALFILSGERKIISRIQVVEGEFELPGAETFAKIDKAFAAEEPQPNWFEFDVTDRNKLDYFRGIKKISAYGGGYVVIYKEVPLSIRDRLLAVRDMRDDWSASKTSKSRTERVFIASYTLLAIIILFGAIWLALWAATRIVQPIGRLMGMAEKVSSGELNSRVDVQKNDGELGALARAMNHMTAQLQTQRDDLIETNRQFDARRRFTEAVLSGVSAGVIGVSQAGRITIGNRSASDLVGVDIVRLTGSSISDVLPEVQDLLLEASDCHGLEVSDQIEIERDGRVKTINVRIASDETDGERSFVVTFDDITQLVAAQRSAAWGDVARRIAHEIKNPLTPIQLSAERLRRKYTGEIKSSPEIFDKCTDTIIRHVNDIGRMVDEFSSFARMPKPVIAREDVFDLVKAAVFPQRVTFPDIEFETHAPAHPVFAQCDGRLIVQALSNIIKNAGESIGVRIAGGDPEAGKIVVRLKSESEEARIDVIDNGVGLPKNERHRLTEPYMTTRSKGTGLGLAIVKKVIEEHGGALSFSDDPSFGATGARMTLTLPLDGAAISEMRLAATATAAE